MNWQPIETVPRETYVLVARKSGMTTIKWEFITAIYDPDYKGWTDVDNCRLTESGDDPLFWMPLPESPKG